MMDFLLYMTRSGLYLGIFYCFYLLVIRRTTLFGLNRMVLLGGSFICALLPLLRIKIRTLHIGFGVLSVADAESASLALSQQPSFSWQVLIMALYGIGGSCVILFTILSGIRMFRLVRTGEKTTAYGFRTIVLPENHPSFSFGRSIVISRQDLEENPVIFLHEKMHVEYRHYLDLLAFRIFQTIWWWHPLVWVMRTELGLLHEYQADEAVLNAGVQEQDYQMLLVRKAVGDERFVMASGFQYSRLKSRIAMMQKSNSPKWVIWSYLAVLPFLSVAVYAYNPTRIERPDEDMVHVSLMEQKPSFPGGDIIAFALWVNEHLQYPEAATAAGIQGRIIVGFTVDTDGSMKDIHILRGAHPDLDAEVLRVMNSCQMRWTPGMRDDKPVKVTYTFPITFQLR